MVELNSESREMSERQAFWFLDGESVVDWSTGEQVAVIPSVPMRALPTAGFAIVKQDTVRTHGEAVRPVAWSAAAHGDVGD